MKIISHCSRISVAKVNSECTACYLTIWLQLGLLPSVLGYNPTCDSRRLIHEDCISTPNFRGIWSLPGNITFACLHWNLPWLRLCNSAGTSRYTFVFYGMNGLVKGFPNKELKTFPGTATQMGRTPKSHSEPSVEIIAQHWGYQNSVYCMYCTCHVHLSVIQADTFRIHSFLLQEHQASYLHFCLALFSFRLRNKYFFPTKGNAKEILTIKCHERKLFLKSHWCNMLKEEWAESWWCHTIIQPKRNNTVWKYSQQVSLRVSRTSVHLRILTTLQSFHSCIDWFCLVVIACCWRVRL